MAENLNNPDRISNPPACSASRTALATALRPAVAVILIAASSCGPARTEYKQSPARGSTPEQHPPGTGDATGNQPSPGGTSGTDEDPPEDNGGTGNGSGSGEDLGSGSGEGSGSGSDDDDTDDQTGAKPSALDLCRQKRSASPVNDPAALSALINTLTPPVTIPCVLAALPRPLALAATNSRLSVQPAFDDENPRIFIFAGDMILAVSAMGELSDAIEFSVLVSNSRSVKGELKFPVTGQLAADAGFTAVVRKDAGGNPVGTRCAGCHFNEAQDNTDSTGQTVWVSTALRPFTHQMIDHEFMIGIMTACASQVSERCAFYQALWDNDDVEARDFPADMPTQF